MIASAIPLCVYRLPIILPGLNPLIKRHILVCSAATLVHLHTIV
jgi:hypothetical protein